MSPVEASGPRDFGGSAGTVITVGTFDGVHRGHRAVLSRIVKEARQRDALAVAITFDPHPLAVLRPEAAPAVLTGLEYKLSLLAERSLDDLKAFKHIEAPKEINVSVLRALFEALGSLFVGDGS